MKQQQSSVYIRNLKFELDASVPRFWLGGERSVTAFFNNLSILFPAGERFFMEAVSGQRGAVTEPKLAADVRGFFGQEGVHTREHVAYNAMLRAQGYPVEVMEERVEHLLAHVRQLLSPRAQLAATCGFEHLTALLAHWVLSHPELLADAHPTMAALWRWHAAEEGEHKAVAFDVFKAAGGTYGERSLVMVLATALFFYKVVEQQLRLMHADGTLGSPLEHKKLWHFLFVKGRIHTLVPHYLAYFRRHFEPWHLDDRHLLEAWKAAYEGLGERRTG